MFSSLLFSNYIIMKKNLLFSLLAVFLAWFWFGGITNATSIECYTDSVMSTSVKATIWQWESMKCYSKVADAYEELEEWWTINLIKSIGSKDATLNITENSARNFYLNIWELKPSLTYIKTDNPYLINYEVDPSNKQLYEFNIEDAYFHIERTYYNEKDDTNHENPLIYNIYSSTSLRNAITNAQAKQYWAKITLLRDFEDKSTASPNVTKNVIFDLNGQTLNLTTKPILISEWGTLTIENWTIISSNTVTDDGNNNYSIALNWWWTLIIWENVTIISHNDKAIVNNWWTVTLNGGKITADTNWIALWKNAIINITSWEIKATKNFAIAGNWTEWEWWYGITITDWTITSTNGPAIYHPNNGTLTINWWTIQGLDALYIKAWTTIITDWTLIWNWEKADYEFNWNGVNPTWDWIVVENAGYPGWNPTVTINWWTISSTNNKAIGYYKKESSPVYPDVTATSKEMTLTDGWLWVEDWEKYKPQQWIIVTFTDWEDEIEKQTIVNPGKATKPEIDPTKEGNIFDWWFKWDETIPFDFDTEITENTELKAKWSTAYTITLTQPSNWWTISSDNVTAKEWAEITLTATPTSNYNFTSWTVKDADDNNITVTDNSFVMPAKNVTVTATFTKKSTSTSWWAGGGGGNSSSSCKSLPSNAVANNSKKPSSSTNYFYDTDTTKVCSFVCKEGYEWNKSSSKCEVKKTTTTTWDNTKVDEPKVEENNENAWTDIGGTPSKEFSKEFNDAYQFAYKNWITTMNSIEKADMYAPLTRVAMAKMLSQYAINVLGKTPDTTKVVPTFPDVDEQLNKDYNDWVTLAYQLGIMWIWIEEFRPFDLVTRAEFGTALSRMLYGLADGEWDQWYKTHLDKLMNEKIITIDTPDLQELRGYVMIMLMRSV